MSINNNYNKLMEWDNKNILVKLKPVFMRNDKPNLIIDLTRQFAIKMIVYCEELDSHHKFIISKQLLRCSTSIGANVREAQNAETRKDFIHKMKIAAKESDETNYWLDIIQEVPSYPQPTPILLNELKSINLVLSKIISTTKKHLKSESAAL